MLPQFDDEDDPRFPGLSPDDVPPVRIPRPGAGPRPLRMQTTEEPGLRDRLASNLPMGDPDRGSVPPAMGGGGTMMPVGTSPSAPGAGPLGAPPDNPAGKLMPVGGPDTGLGSRDTSKPFIAKPGGQKPLSIAASLNNGTDNALALKTQRDLASWNAAESTPGKVWSKPEAGGIKNPILRWMARVGDVAGSAMFPGVTAMIPETKYGHKLDVIGKENQYKADVNAADVQSQTAERNASTDAKLNPNPTTEFELWRNQNPYSPVEDFVKLQHSQDTGKTGEDLTLHDLMTGENGKPRVNPQTGQPYTYLEAFNQLHQPKPDTATQNKETFQHSIGVLRGEGLLKAGDVTDFKKIAAAVEKSKQLSAGEKDAMVGYMGANPTPGTNLTVKVQGQENSNALADDRMFKGKEVVIHTADGRRLQMSYGDAKKQGISLDDMTILNANEAQANRDKYASVATTMDHVKRYRNDFKTVSSQLTDQDRSALGVLTSHSDKVADSFLGVAQSGIIDTLIGKPLTGYSEKLMGAWMTKDQYDKMSPAGKRMLADYVATGLANFANIKAVMGSVPRNPQIIQLEMARIPLPYIDWQSASPAFDDFRDDIKGRSGSLPEVK